jgi:hypothetical protein
MSSLILYDDYNNLFHCNYVNHDNLDKFPVCFIEYVQPNGQELPPVGTIMHYYDNVNGIIRDYFIYYIIYKNACSILCKICAVFYENPPPVQYFAFIHPMSMRTLHWSIRLQNFLQPCPDYLICKLYNDQRNFLIVAVERSRRLPNSYMIRPLEKNEYDIYHNTTIINHIYLIENQLSLSLTDHPILHNWLNRFKSHQYYFSFQKLVQHASEKDAIKQDHVILNVPDNNITNKHLIANQEDETTSESITDNLSDDNSCISSNLRESTLSDSADDIQLDSNEIDCHAQEDIQKLDSLKDKSIELEKTKVIYKEKQENSDEILIPIPIPNEKTAIISPQKKEISEEKTKVVLKEEKEEESPERIPEGISEEKIVIISEEKTKIISEEKQKSSEKISEGISEEKTEIVFEEKQEISEEMNTEMNTKMNTEMNSNKKEDLLEERDTFYDGCFDIPIHESEYCINKQVISFKEEEVVDDEIASITTTSNESSISLSNAQKNQKKRLKKKQKILAEKKIDNQDNIIDLIYLFDSFYESYIIQNVIPRNIIYDKFLELITLYEKELQEKDTQSIFEFIFEKFKANFPSIMNDPSYINSNFLEEKSSLDDLDLENTDHQDEQLIMDIVNKELENIISTKNDGVILLPYIKKFREVFGDVFKHLDSDKKKVLLLYFSFSLNSGLHNLTEYFKLVPSILFRTKDGIASNGYLEEEKVIIFHMTWLLNTFNKYIIEKLYKNSTEKNTPQLIKFLNRLLFQYFATYIVHNEINAILVVPKNIFNHYVRIIVFHLKYLFPNFHYKAALNLQKINMIETEKPFIDKFIVKSRLMVSKLLETLPDEKYYVATGYMSKFLDTYFYNKNKDLLNSFMLNENPNRDSYFENQIHIHFKKVVNMLNN